MRDIRVEGLQRVEPGTIFASLPFRVGETYSDDKGSTAIRALFALGLFKDVRLEVNGDVLVVIVEERPTIADVSFVDQLRHHAIDVTIVSPDDTRLPDPDWRHIRGHLDEKTLADLVKNEHEPAVYVSGPPAMVVKTSRIVRGFGVKTVKVDEFAGY